MSARPDVQRIVLWSLASFALVTASACAKHDAPLNDSTAALAPAPAETPATTTPTSGAALTPVRGTVAAVNDTALTVTTANGPQQVSIVPPLHVYERTPSDLAHVTPSSFVGITSVKQPDGTERATEIHIFPEELRGTGEGSRMMEQTAPGGGSRMTNGSVSGSRMTNGSVSGSRMTNGTVGSTGGTTYTVQYQGGAQTIQVPANVTVTAIAPSQTKLSVGTNVIVLAHTGTDGRLQASGVMLGGPTAGSGARK
jgi:hypothetical protein